MHELYDYINNEMDKKRPGIQERNLCFRYLWMITMHHNKPLQNALLQRYSQ